MDRKAIQNVLRQQFVYLWSMIVLDRNEKSLDFQRCDAAELTSNITERTRYLTKSDCSYNEQYMYNTSPNSSRAEESPPASPECVFITALDAASVGPLIYRAELVSCQDSLSTIVAGALFQYLPRIHKFLEVRVVLPSLQSEADGFPFSSQDMKGHGALKMGEPRQQEKRSTRRREGTTVLWPCKT